MKWSNLTITIKKWYNMTIFNHFFSKLIIEILSVYSCFIVFVIISVIFSYVTQYLSSITPSLVKSRKKWNFTSMCLLRLRMIGFLDSLIEELLSHNIVIHLSWKWSKFFKTLIIHIDKHKWQQPQTLL